MMMTLSLRLERQVLGNHAWGTFRNSSPAHGQWVCELVVYPPGITAGQRWVVGLDRLAPLVGAIAGIVLSLLTFDLLPRWTMLILLVLPSVGTSFLVHRLTSRIRCQLRSIVVAQDYGSYPPAVEGDAVLFDGCHSALKALDAEADLLSLVEYERRWGEVYHRLAHRSNMQQSS